ncbi:MAG: hypothetical protein IJL80_03400 [Treponema sp.]|nr:hypothetical protein [Treponema sp.]
MEKIDFVPLVLAVIKDWRVIFITVLMILFVSIGNYVLHYVKKVKPIKKKKVAPPPPPPKKEEGEEEEGGGDEE